MFNLIKKKIIQNRLQDEILYEYVAEEIEENIKNKGLWAKAYAQSEGDLNKVEPLYMQYRVQAIKDVFTSLEIIYSELSRAYLFKFIANGFKDLPVVKISLTPQIDKLIDKMRANKITKSELEELEHLKDRRQRENAW